jgi:hypothetical protein
MKNKQNSNGNKQNIEEGNHPRGGFSADAECPRSCANSCVLCLLWPIFLHIQNPQFLAKSSYLFPEWEGQFYCLAKSGTFEKQPSRKCEKERAGTGREKICSFSPIIYLSEMFYNKWFNFLFQQREQNFSSELNKSFREQKKELERWRAAKKGKKYVGRMRKEWVLSVVSFMVKWSANPLTMSMLPSFHFFWLKASWL